MEVGAGKAEGALEDELGELLEQERFEPPEDFVANALITDESLHERAASDPLAWWAELADDLDWETKWDTVLDDSKPRPAFDIRAVRRDARDPGERGERFFVAVDRVHGVATRRQRARVPAPAAGDIQHTASGRNELCPARHPRRRRFVHMGQHSNSVLAVLQTPPA